MASSPDFLERLSDGMGCMYLSDLRFLSPSGNWRLSRLIKRIPVSEVPFPEWREALRYLTGQEAEQMEPDAVKQQLVSYLSSRN